MTLDQKDIIKIKKEMTIGNLVLAMVVVGIAVFDLIQIFSKTIDTSVILIINLAAAALGFGFKYLMNAKFQKDLKSNEKIFKTETIAEKIEKSGYEAGSGTLYIPILGDLFPKLWNQEMRKMETNFVRINNEMIPVDKQLFDSLSKNEKVKVFYTEFSETLLNIEKIDGFVHSLS